MATVECYAGSTYPEHPRAFVWQGARYVVTRVLRQWRERDPSAEAATELWGFEVEARAGGTAQRGGKGAFILRYAPAADHWDITPYSNVSSGV